MQVAEILNHGLSVAMSRVAQTPLIPTYSFPMRYMTDGSIQPHIDQVMSSFMSEQLNSSLFTIRTEGQRDISFIPAAFRKELPGEVATLLY